MSELHIIIHEYAVKICADAEIDIAKKVLDEIDGIKSSKYYLEFEDYRNPHELHPDMPPVSDDLEVFISGGYKELCCELQLAQLRKEGYHAMLHPTATLSGKSVMFFLLD